MQHEVYGICQTDVRSKWSDFYIWKKVKFVLGKYGDKNFMDFSKFSLEISHLFFAEDADLTFKNWRVSWSKYDKKYEWSLKALLWYINI